MKADPHDSPELRRAYASYTLDTSTRNAKVACALVIALMPAGALLDYFVYPQHGWFFLKLRLLCSAVTAIVLWRLARPHLRDWQQRLLGMGWYLLPAFFISWMIGATDGPTSSYYAGLCLVILAVSSVIQAGFGESLIAIGLILAMYLAACLLHGGFADGRDFVNNMYFLLLTALIVLTGNFFFNRLRWREFVLRFELDQSRQEIAENNRKLVELDRVKNRFFANVSHELRTPLTLLLAPLEVLLRADGTSSESAQRRELLSTMHTNGMRLLKMINDLLDLVRLESGRLEVHRDRIAVEPFLQGLLSSVRRTAEERGLNLTANVDPAIGIIVGDNDKLEKILLNLLFNSLKFTPAGGRVEVAAARQDDSLLFRVRDTGVGIAADKLPFIFDRFWQADNSAQRQYQGVGIGLSLVKELVEAQNGWVSVISQVGEGSEFTVTLPYITAATSDGAAAEARAVDSVATPAANVPEDWMHNLYRRAELFHSIVPLRDGLRPEEFSAHRSGKPKVLIADDEPDMLRFLRAQLADEFEVFEATDGQQAIDKAAQFLPDVVLTDMMMPLKDGNEVCRELRDRASTRAIPIVLLTAWGEEDLKLRALANGASDFLTKPFSTTELQVRLHNLVVSHQTGKSLARQKQILEATLEELKDTEAQLVHSEKLASLGQMSAGLIHEINNPLNYAKTGLYSLRSLRQRLETNDQAIFDDILGDIQDGLDRVQQITADLYRFAHPNSDQFEDVAVETLVRTALRLVSHEWRAHVTIKEDIDGGLKLWGNAVQLTQLLVNLLQNAFQAVQKKSFPPGQAAVWIVAKRTGDEVWITVRDNGTGIAAGDLGRIFDPFFTTKDVGEGMGLGLSICHRIAEQHRGRIDVRSEAGEFTEFILRLPAQSTNPGAAAQPWRPHDQHV